MRITLFNLFLFLSINVLNAQTVLSIDDVSFHKETGTITDYLSNYTDIVIPNSFEVDGEDIPVISIEIAFIGKSITSVVLPNSLVNIKSSAFTSNNLSEIIIPSSVERIERGAFANNSLVSVVFEKNSKIHSICSEAFANNPDLLGFILPTNSNNEFLYYYDKEGNQYDADEEVSNLLSAYFIPHVLTIDDVEFEAETGTIVDYKANNIAISIPSFFNVEGVDKPVNNIGDDSFILSRLESLVLQEGLIKIGESAFSLSYLSSLKIPNSVTHIGDKAFERNELIELELPNSIKKINSSAFIYNKLTTVFLPSSIIEIGNRAFSNNSLNTILLPSKLEVLGNEAFYSNELSEVYIPKSVKIIAKGVFKSNNVLDVEFEGNSLVKHIGDGAFSGNVGLEGLMLPTNINESFTNYKSGNGDTYNPGDKITNFDDVYYLDSPIHTISLSDIEFDVSTKTITKYNANYPEIEIPNSFEINGEHVFVKIIGKEAFKEANIVHVKLPNNVKKIEEQAFVANSISTIRFPDGVNFIGRSAFANNAIRSLTLPSSITHIDRSGFATNYIKELIFDGAGIKYLGLGCFASNQLTTINLPNSIVSIGRFAFAWNNLSSINFENNSKLRSIAEMAFFSNYNLKSYILPTNVNDEFVNYVDRRSNTYGPLDEVPEANLRDFIYADLPTHTLTIEDVVFNDGEIKCYTGGYSDIIIPTFLNVDGYKAPVLSLADLSFQYQTINRLNFEDNSYVRKIGRAALHGNRLLLGFYLPYCYDKDLIWMSTSQVEYMDGQWVKPNYSTYERLDNMVVFFDSNVEELQFDTSVNSVTPPKAPYKENYEFKGWNTRVDGSGDMISDFNNIDGDLFLYAYYDSPTSIYDKSNNNISIFPNPVLDMLRVKWSRDLNIKVIQVYNMSGVEVYSNEVNSLDADMIDLSAEKSGVLLLKLIAENGEIYLEKVVKK